MTRPFKLGVLALILFPLLNFAQSKTSFIESIESKNGWVDSVYKNLSRKERIAQLFMVRAHTDKGKRYEDSVAKVISSQHLGGVVFFQGGPGRQAALTNQYQSQSKVPLLVATDAEWGLGMRLDSAISYPYQMTLGAIQDNNLIYQMGKQVALDFKRLGLHVNFAPDADINNNPNNPVIGYRSFGDNKYNVTAKVGAYMKGLQDEGILVSLKHFPGHGDTDVDSHYDLPQLKFSRERLDSLELYPFRELVKQGASGVMIAHMSIPILDNTPHLPATLSKKIVTDILKKEMNFKGLVFSDAMEMKGVVKYFPNGEADVMAFIAGNDILELSENSERGINLIRKAIKEKRIRRKQLKVTVKKILTAKYWAGLNNYQPVNVDGVYQDIHRSESIELNQKLADAAVTILKSDSLIKNIDYTKKTAIVSIGVDDLSLVQRELTPRFTDVLNFVVSKKAANSDIQAISNELRKFEQVILTIHDTRKRPQSVLDYTTNLKLLIADIAKLNTISVLFANPYTIAGLPGIEISKSLIVNYQQNDDLQRASVKVITGQIKANGKLPVTINSFFKNGDGVTQK
ncbi:MAG: glycoside hydrolase family 3 domain protein [Sphingobacteriales bacterium]|nr:glycoside hydrolase family 3 domain protein [Sphingobacteriales bacterium]